MLNRFAFPAIALFWVCMNILLWRSEFKGAREFGSPVPVNAVWERILTAPDDSALGVLQHGKTVGYCRWRPNVGEEIGGGKVATEDYKLAGRVERLSGYRIDIEGSLSLDGWNERLRFDFQGNFNTNHVWQALETRLIVRPNVWEIRADSGTETLHIRSENETAPWEKEFRFEELQNPNALLSELGFPLLPLLLTQFGLGESSSKLALGLRWEARHDWFEIGHSRIRVYRIEANLFDRFQIVVLVSRVGEILRIELPNQIVLVNEAFAGL